MHFSVIAAQHLLFLPLFLGLTSPVQAEIDPKVRESCLPACDFLRCVKAYTTESNKIQNLRVIQREIELTGNACPFDFAYVGGGNCMEVVCDDAFFQYGYQIKTEYCWIYN